MKAHINLLLQVFVETEDLGGRGVERVACFALHVLCGLGTSWDIPASIGMLREDLASSDEKTRVTALRALGMLGDVSEDNFYWRCHQREVLKSISRWGPSEVSVDIAAIALEPACPPSWSA